MGANNADTFRETHAQEISGLPPCRQHRFSDGVDLGLSGFQCNEATVIYGLIISMEG